MFQIEEKINKDIITPDGEDEFHIRYNRDENVGVVTSRSNKSSAYPLWWLVSA